MPPFLMMGVRSLLAGALLFGWARLRDGARPAAAHWPPAAAVGIVLFLGCHGLLAWAEQTVPSGHRGARPRHHPGLDDAARLGSPAERAPGGRARAGLALGRLRARHPGRAGRDRGCSGRGPFGSRRRRVRLGRRLDPVAARGAAGEPHAGERHAAPVRRSCPRRPRPAAGRRGPRRRSRPRSARALCVRLHGGHLVDRRLHRVHVAAAGGEPDARRHLRLREPGGGSLRGLGPGRGRDAVVARARRLARDRLRRRPRRHGRARSREGGGR